MIITQEKPISEQSPKDLPSQGVSGNSSLHSPLHAMKSPTTVELAQTDEPPPYARHSGASASASALLQPSAFPRGPAPPLPPRHPAPHGNVTNHLYIKTRHEPITGMYHIDPEMDTVALGKEGISAQERRRYNHKHHQRHRHHKRKGLFKRAEVPEPNAIFETRQGAIALSLGIKAGPGSSQSRALVQAASKHGSVNINVLGLDIQRHLNLEVSTRSGNVHILIPRSFSGYIQLYSRHGDLTPLPSLASAMQLVYRRDKEMQFVVGRAIEASSPEKAASWTGDTIHVSSRRGNVVIGYIGEDTIRAKEPRFWKKLTDFFQS